MSDHDKQILFFVKIQTQFTPNNNNSNNNNNIYNNLTVHIYNYYILLQYLFIIYTIHFLKKKLKLY